MKKKIYFLALIIFSLQISISTAQNISTVTPNTAIQGQILAVTISGQNTHFAQGTGTTVWFNQGSQTIFANSTIPVNNTVLMTQLSIPYYAALGLWNVNAYNTVDGSLVKYNSFTITANPNQPQIISIAPDSSMVANSLSVTVTGQNTHFQQGTQTNAWISQGSSTIIPLSSLNIQSNTVFSGTLSIPSNSPLGLYNANVYNSTDGNLNKSNCFTVYQNPNPPSLISLTPDSASINQTTNYTLIGQNTHFTDPSLSIFFTHPTPLVTMATNFNVISDTEVKFDANFAYLLSWDLQVQSITDLNLYISGAVNVYPVGIEEYDNNPYNIKTYPNPFNDNISISGDNFNMTSVKITILNILGQEVFSTLETPNKTLNKKLNLSNLTKGIYFIRIETEEHSVIRKVVKY